MTEHLPICFNEDNMWICYTRLALLVVNNKTKQTLQGVLFLSCEFCIFQMEIGWRGIYGMVQHPTNFSKAPYGLKNEVIFKLKSSKFVREHFHCSRTLFSISEDMHSTFYYFSTSEKKCRLLVLKKSERCLFVTTL